MEKKTKEDGEHKEVVSTVGWYDVPEHLTDYFFNGKARKNFVQSMGTELVGDELAELNKYFKTDKIKFFVDQRNSSRENGQLIKALIPLDIAKDNRGLGSDINDFTLEIIRCVMHTFYVVDTLRLESSHTQLTELSKRFNDWYTL